MYLRSLVLFGLLATCMSSQVSYAEFFQLGMVKTGGQNAYQFMSGFFFGMQANEGKPDQCYKDTALLLSDGAAVYNDILQIAAGNATANQTIYTDADKLSADFVSHMPDCNWAGFATAVKSLTTTSGLTSAIYRCIDNAGSLTTDIGYVKTCSTNYYTCGKGIAEIAKVFLGWGL
mmetsp:Transcript_8662/g.8651  ORF Transcript_8662/g.8651 Transcript_8662/m.8651 type:complete len:175 (-) Transcript_8662:38-562(-)